MDFILFTGRYNSLTTQELASRLPKAKSLYPHVYSFSAPNEKKAISMVSFLGTSIKLAIKLETTDLSVQSLASLIDTKIFSITNLKGSIDNNLYFEIKRSLTGHIRFVKSRQYFGLSPVILQKKKVTELFLDTPNSNVYRTVWSHSYHDWIDKDRKLPFVDPKSGMMPPKIARSLINLTPYQGKPQDLIFLDPFCGSGRLVVEACQLGFNVMASDIVQEKIDHTQGNLKALGFQADIFLADATHLSEKLDKKVDLIVTEPHMGKVDLRPDRVRYVVPGLKKLYLGVLKDWLKILKPGGLVTMIFPILSDDSRTYTTSKIIDDDHLSGYNIKTRGLFYSRPQAKLKREIVILEKK